MPLTNCIVILQTIDGFRIAYIEDINELFWKRVEGTLIQYEEKGELSSEELKSIFGLSKVYDKKDVAWRDAVILYREKLNSGIKIGKDSIRYLQGYEKRSF